MAVSKRNPAAQTNLDENEEMSRCLKCHGLNYTISCLVILFNLQINMYKTKSFTCLLYGREISFPIIRGVYVLECSRTGC
jgi:hypothetical protein